MAPEVGGAMRSLPASPLRLLVVEDDDAVAVGIRLLLEPEWRVDVALGGHRALELLLAGCYDGILCDLMMPGMSGVDLYHSLRAAKPGLERRLVFMTGGAFTAEAEHFLEAVDNPWVEKPFDFSSVHQLLRRVAEGVF